MRYLLVNHVPFGRTASAGAYEVGDMWLEDLRGECRAIRAAGGNLIVAAPCMDRLETVASGSFHSVTIKPEDEGFEYVALPYYDCWSAFLRVRRALRGALRDAIGKSTIVQADTGGYPVPLGQVVWPIAGDMGRKRIWAFDGGDIIGQQHIWASEEPQWAKRWVKKMIVRQFVSFCRNAIRDADLVFSHNASVADHFRDVWNERCHQFDRTFVTEQMLVSDADLAELGRGLLDISKPLRLVAASRQIAIKATDHMLKAVAIAREQGVALKLDIYGDGEELPRYKQVASELKLERAVAFHGSVPYGPELFKRLSESQVMVVTNVVPELSRNLLLAMARGLPLVAYNNPGHDAMLKASGAGILVPTGDITRLADALIGAARDRARLVELASSGLKTARSKMLDGCHRQRIDLVLAMLGCDGKLVA
jgi:glycosyltransferase involved in cell wall biosynthesis